MVLSSSIPLSLYVHIPWCVKKCPYCDFNSHEQLAPRWEEYVYALLDDLEKEAVSLDGRTINTIFFGGGTPSLMPAKPFSRLMAGIQKRVSLDPAAEVTLEANPGTSDADNFDAYFNAGVNRLSIGAQSFRNRQLELLGRVHRVDAIMKTILIARSIGFENINVDLMHSLPEDTAEGSLADLRHAIKLSAPHISWYELTLEDNTPFQRHPPARPLHETIIEAHSVGTELLETEDYVAYEISAYAQENSECRHNLNYWQFGDYIGIGAGAHGKITDENGVYRTEKRRSPNSYMKGVRNDDHCAPKRLLDDAQLVSDFAINAFRLTQGFDEDLFEQRTGLAINKIDSQLELAEQKHFLTRENGVIKPTVLGLQFLNELQILFI